MRTRGSPSGNLSTLNGGGVVVQAGNLTLQNSTVSDNRAWGGGGGVFARDANVTVFGSTVSGNSSHVVGAGIRIVRGDVELVNSTLALNRAEQPPEPDAHDQIQPCQCFGGDICDGLPDPGHLCVFRPAGRIISTENSTR